MQRPQRMQADGSGSAAAFLLNSSRPLFCLSTGKSALGAAPPIIGPPKMILPSSTPSLTPPQASMTSRYSVPMGTSMFWGLAMASPSTVTRFVTSGMPVLRNLPSVETLVTFMMTQPTSAGRPGLPEGPTCGTSRPVQVSTSVFSAPCG